MVERQQSITDRQHAILMILATNGMQTQSQLSIEFKINYPSIVGSIKILKDKKLTKIVRKEPGIGKAKLYYGITDKGLEALSKDPRTKLEDFWTIAFLIYGKITKTKTNLSVTNFFSNYEKSVMHYDLNYSSLSWNFILDTYDFLYKRPIAQSSTITMLYILASNGWVSAKKFFQIINNTNSSVQIPNMDDAISKLNNLVSNKLVIVNGQKISRYRISSIGILVLFHYMIDSHVHKSSSEHQRKELEFNLSVIVKKSNFILPMVFLYWKQLAKIDYEINLLLRFTGIGSNIFPTINSIRTGGILEYLVIEKMMIKSNYENISLEYKTGLETLTKLMKTGKYPEKHPSDAIDMLNFLGLHLGYVKIEQKTLWRITKQKQFSIEEKIDKGLADMISFEFYLYLFDMQKRMLPSLFESNTSNNKKLDPWQKKKIRDWNTFLKKNPKLKKWFNNWIFQILNYQEKNIEIINEKLETSKVLSI